MISKNKGFSLVVLIITIAVIIIITTTAVISMKNLNNDKDISNFMSDLDTVKQYVIEYYAQNDTLPVKFENGKMVSASGDGGLIDLLTKNNLLGQLSEDDTGEYYYVDISKLGKIHLSNYDRGYILNEGSLNIYVINPCTYEGNDYYALTEYLLGKEIGKETGIGFTINIQGNPITWSKNAELLLSIPNVKVGEADGWNFKWGKEDDVAGGDTSKLNYFIYGNTVKITENGVYTFIAENPEGKSLSKNVVISKIDNIPPVVMFSDGKLYMNDAETGISTIRCKIKETSNFAIDDETRNNYPEYYTMSTESFADTPETLVEKYLWGEQKIKGETIDNYLKTYEEYYEKISKFNAVLASSLSTSGERENANKAIKELNQMYPQFSYDNRRYSDTEKNIVIYVEDEAGNGTVYSALNRLELRDSEYVSGDSKTLLDSSVTINSNDRYTNSRDVTLYLQSMYAKDVFTTEEQVPTASWVDFDNQYQDFRLSNGDGEKTVYAFFRDKAGKIASAYDKIHLDTTLPSNDAPTVKYDETNGLSITVNQTDTDIVDDVETQSGLTGIFQFAIKAETDPNYIWYSRASAIPKLEKGVTYYIMTKATDKAGNEQTSKPVTLKP